MGVLNFQSDYLSGEKWFIEKFCRNKIKVAVDVGGNVGHYSEVLIQNNKGVRLYSFEPHPSTFKALKASADRFGYLAMNLAVGAEPGFIDLYDHAARDGSQHASVYRGVIEDVHKSQSTHHRVPMTTLDSFMEDTGISRIDLLKIDTEGNELHVLSGAKKAIIEGRIELIHFEFNVTNVVSRVFMKDFYDLLSTYRLYRMLPDGLILLHEYGLDVADVEIFAFQNIVAIHKNTKVFAPTLGGKVSP
jgi:FkbM family methyltransferase